MNVRGAIPWLLLLAVCTACDDGPAPKIDTAGMEPPVRELIRERRAAVAERETGGRWGALGDALLAHGLEAEAAECYARAVPLTEDPFDWLYLQALADPGQAEALLDRAESFRADQPLVALRRGMLHQEAGRHEAAAEAFARARQLDPALQRAWRGLGQSALASGDLDAAIPALEQAVTLFSGDAAAWSALAQAYAAAERMDEAREASERAGRGVESPGFRDPVWEAHVVESGVSTSRRFQRALRALANGDAARARAQVEAILEVREDDADAHHMMGLIESRSGNVDEAVRHFERALDADPDHARSLLELAAAAERGGRFDDAVRWNRRAHELTPHDAGILLAIARLEHRRNDPEGVLRALEGLLELQPDNLVYRLDAGDLHAHAERWEQAEAQYREAIRRDPASADAHYRLGLLFERTSRNDLAAESYRRALELDPASPAATKLASPSGD